MLNSSERLFISNQFANNDYCRDELELKTRCNNSSSTFFTSVGSENTNSCGDYIALAVKKNNKQFEEIFFSRQEACIIVVSATNILCKWIIGKGKSFPEITTLLTNVRRMVNGEEYELGDCQEIGVFSSLKSFIARKSCLLLVVDSFSQIIAG